MATGVMRKQSGSGSNKAAFKEKIIKMYEVILLGEDPEKCFGESFWSEFFLLNPKVGILEAETSKLTSEQFSVCRSNLNRLFDECLANLSMSQERPICVVYALQTLCGLIRAVFLSRGTDDGFDVIHALVGFDAAERRMRELIEHLNFFLISDQPASLKEVCLKLILILVTAVDNISRNTLMEYVMMSNIFESLLHLLSHSDSRAVHGRQVLLILTLLLQYRKYESPSNPYAVKLSILDQEMTLHGYAQVITFHLKAYTSTYEATLDSQQTSQGWFGSITSLVGNMFISDEGCVHRIPASRSALLLALYEAVHLNRNFITALVHSQTASVRPGSVSSIQPPGEANNDEDVNGGRNSKEEGGSDDLHTSESEASSVPCNLLATFLEYCSIVMQNTKTETSRDTVKLCFLVLLCATEDHYANALFHDSNLVFRVKLHQAPTRHRKIPVSNISNTWEGGSQGDAAPSRSLVCSMLDLMVEFLRSHLMKRLPHELYSLSLSIVQRLLSYQKRARVRLSYPWKELWTALISLVKFITANESALIKIMNPFSVSMQVVVIFNLFITYGDTFLPSPSSYDELYYELVRCRAIFDSLYSMALRYSSTGGGEYKDSAVRVTNALTNVRAITAHFSPKIDTWLAQQQLSTPSEDQILEVVKANYDSLTLKLQDALDQYERYSESPKYVNFFTTLVRNMVSDTRHQVVLTDLDLQVILHDFSTIQ